MRAFLRALTNPVGALWVVSHIVVVVLGVLFLTAASFHKVLGQGISEGIGGSLIAGGIAGVTLFLYVFTTEGLKSRIEAFAKAGLLKIFSGRSVLIRDEYDTRLAKARHIDLVGFGLSALREDYINDFVGWSHRADVRILLIDPEFQVANTVWPTKGTEKRTMRSGRYGAMWRRLKKRSEISLVSTANDLRSAECPVSLQSICFA